MHRVLAKTMAGAATAVAAAIALGLLTASPSAQSQAQTPPRPSGVVIGRVVDGATATGVQGAIVTLTGPGIRPRRVLVDARGRFVFTELPPGTFTITSTKTRYLAGAYGALRPDGAGRSLELGDGERVLDAVVRMWRYSTISGVVTDDAGDAVPYARVQALRRTVVAGRWQLVNSNIGANSDDTGAYRITGLVPGDYALVITSMVSSLPASLLSVADLMRRMPGPESSAKMAELSTNGTGGFANDLMQGFGTQRFGDLLLQSTNARISPDGRTLETYPTVWYPSGATPAEAASVTLGPGDARTGIDLHPALIRTRTVSGTVTGPDGPVPHLAMRIVPAALDNTTAEITSSLSNSLTTAMTASDGNGAFTFVAVPPGQYIIRAVTSPRPLPEPQTPGAAPLPPLISKDPIWWTATPISVGQEDTKGVTVVLRQGVRVTGRVEFVGSAPRPTPAELRLVRLSMDPADGRSVAYSSAYQAQIDSDGRFYTIGLMAGRYLLRLDTPPRGWMLQSAIVNGRDICDVPISIDGDAIDGLVVTFTDRPSIVNGTVRKTDGRPDDDATVLIFPSTGRWTDLGTNPRSLRSARASRSGAFRVSGLPPGEYFIVAVSDAVAGNWQEPAFLQRLARIATRFTLTPGQNLTQTLSTAEGVVR